MAKTSILLSLLLASFALASPHRAAWDLEKRASSAASSQASSQATSKSKSSSASKTSTSSSSSGVNTSPLYPTSTGPAFTTISTAFSSPTAAGVKKPVQSGLVNFGDSYAAGIGAGYTTGHASGNDCRVGTNYYGAFLAGYAQQFDSNIDWQSYVCSGDTTKGLLSKIDLWQNPGQTDVATVSIGGNNIGFSDIVLTCIWFDGNCDGAIQDAQNTLKPRTLDGSDTLWNALNMVYKKIVQKRGSSSLPFKIYTTSYGRFFNENTTLCNDSTFDLFHPQYIKNHDDILDSRIFLSQALRQKLNSLLLDFNSYLSDAVDQANKDLGADYVKFVNWDGAFEGHRFCEGSNVEPIDREDTWYFLQWWKDADMIVNGSTLTNGNTSQAQQNTQANLETYVDDTVQAKQNITLPDPGSCSDDPSAGDGQDPWDTISCYIANVAKNTSSEAYKQLQYTNNAIQNAQPNEIDTQDVSQFYPAGIVKGFHPRTPGHQIIAQQVILALEPGITASNASAATATKSTSTTAKATTKLSTDTSTAKSSDAAASSTAKSSSTKASSSADAKRDVKYMRKA